MPSVASVTITRCVVVVVVFVIVGDIVVGVDAVVCVSVIGVDVVVIANDIGVFFSGSFPTCPSLLMSMTG